MSSAKQCCVPGCEETQGVNVLHKFPNPAKERKRFNDWLYAVGGNIIGLENEHIYKYRRVCRRHFEDKYLCRSNKISNIAIPTLNMPGPLASRKYSLSERHPMRLIQTIDENLVEPSTSRGLTTVQEDLSGKNRPSQHPQTIPELPAVSVTDCQNLSTTHMKMCMLEDTSQKENIDPFRAKQSEALSSCASVSETVGSQKNVSQNEETPKIVVSKRKRTFSTPAEQALHKKLVQLAHKLNKCRNINKKQSAKLKNLLKISNNPQYLKALENVEIPYCYNVLCGEDSTRLFIIRVRVRGLQLN